MIDTHCHLQTEAYDTDREAVLERSRTAGVGYLLVPAIDLASLEPTLRLASSHSTIFCALGIHPHSAAEWNVEVRDWILEQASQNSKVVAIGEIGLDYHYDFCPKDVQQRAFSDQIRLAISLKKPIVIHTRESDEDVLRIVEEHYGDKQSSITGQFHCFSGSVATMHRAIELGFYVSFTGNITFKNSKLGEVVREAPIERILLETDSPYMTPVPFRGKRNAPEYLSLIAAKIAEIKSIDITEVMHQTFENAKRLFSLPVSMPAKIGPTMLVALLGLFLSFCSSSALAQRSDPVGGAPPDSVMNDDRRKSEELIRLQREDLRKEAAKRTQDSLIQVQKDQQEEQLKAVEQLRQDSIKAARRIEQAEEDTIRARTPIAWKVIGIGGALGVGNMALSQNKSPQSTTSVLATSLQLSTQLTRVIDFEFSWMKMRVGDNLAGLYNSGVKSPTGPYAPGQPIGNGDELPFREDFYVTALAADFRFAITPKNPFKFYAGLGYTYLMMENNQQYYLQTDSGNVPGVNGIGHSKNPNVYTTDTKFYRSAIDILFGVRWDFEFGSQFILTPFAEISALAAFQGQTQGISYVFQTDPTLITMTHFRMGVTLNWGWFGVERYH